MIKIMIAFAPPKGMSEEACLDHYAHNHGPLVRSVPEFTGYVRGYLQNYVRTRGGGRVPFCGVSELWFGSAGELTDAYRVPRYLEQVRPDEFRFADTSSALFLYVSDDVVIPSATEPSFKLLRFHVRADGQSQDDFEREWTGTFRHVARRAAAEIDGVLFYAQNRVERPDGTPFEPSSGIGGVDEFWTASAARAVQLAARLRESVLTPGLGSATIDLITEVHRQI